MANNVVGLFTCLSAQVAYLLLVWEVQSPSPEETDCRTRDLKYYLVDTMAVSFQKNDSWGGMMSLFDVWA